MKNSVDASIAFWYGMITICVVLLCFGALEVKKQMDCHTKRSQFPIDTTLLIRSGCTISPYWE